MFEYGLASFHLMLHSAAVLGFVYKSNRVTGSYQLLCHTTELCATLFTSDPTRISFSRIKFRRFNVEFLYYTHWFVPMKIFQQNNEKQRLNRMQMETSQTYRTNTVSYPVPKNKWL